MTAAKIGYWPGQADFQIKAVNAWITVAEKRNNEALRLTRASANAEEASDKHPVTPGNLVPSRQLLGEMLLVAGQPQQALLEFERSLKRDLDRFRIYGAARATEAAVNLATIAIHGSGCACSARTAPAAGVCGPGCTIATRRCPGILARGRPSILRGHGVIHAHEHRCRSTGARSWALGLVGRAMSAFRHCSYRLFAIADSNARLNSLTKGTLRER